MKPPKATKSLAENLPSLDAPKTVDVMPTKTARVWVSYDLGIDGDYTGFHTWLDDHEAKECGAATATFVLTYQRTIEGRIMAELKRQCLSRRAILESTSHITRATEKSSVGFLSASESVQRGSVSLSLARIQAMRGEVAQYVLCDSCFWLSLYSDRENNHKHALAARDRIQRFHVVVMWPILYESLGTRMLRRRDIMNAFLSDLAQPGVHKASDVPYRDSAMRQLTQDNRDLSLTDRVLRHYIADERRGSRITHVLTFNEGDFADVCYANDIEMIAAVPKKR